MTCPKCQYPQDIYQHPVYKSQRDQIRQNQKQIFEDRNTINQLCSRLHNLELRVMSLTRQLEQDHEQKL